MAMTNQPGSSMNGDIYLDAYIGILIRRWYIVVSLLLISMAGAYILGQQGDQDIITSNIPMYESRAKLLLKGDGSLTFKDFQSDAVEPDVLASLATSNDLLTKVIDRIDLRHHDSDLWWSVEDLSGVLTAEVPKKSRQPMLVMKVRTSDPKLSHKIAVAWVDLFKDTTDMFANAGATKSADFLLGEAAITDQLLKDKQSEKLSFQKDYPLTSQEQALKAAIDKYDSYARKIHEVELSLKKKEAILISLSESIEDSELRGILTNDLNTIEIPKLYDGNLIRASDYLELTRILVKSDLESLIAEKSYLNTQIQSMEDEIDNFANVVNENDLHLSKLDREIKLLSRDSAILKEQWQETRMLHSQEASSVVVIDAPSEPSAPTQVSTIGPTPDFLGYDVPGTLVIGAILGLIFGGVIAFLVDYIAGYRSRTASNNI